MGKQVLPVLILALLFTISSAKEWYQQGHTNFLTWKNFDETVKEPGKYKFVKFFTHNCRYCRMLKQVQEKLMKQKEWPFPFYSVDCSKHYDLCKKKVQVKSFPFVGIYDDKGQLEAQFTGYYPVDVIRDVLNNVTARQAYVLKNSAVTDKSEQKEEIVEENKHVEHIRPALLHKKQEEKHKKEVHQKESKVQEKAHSEQNERWASITTGIQIVTALLGYWWFQTSILPYFTAKDVSEGKSKTIEIPVNGSNNYSKVKQDDQSSKLMSDVL